MARGCYTACQDSPGARERGWVFVPYGISAETIEIRHLVGSKNSAAPILAGIAVIKAE